MQIEKEKIADVGETTRSFLKTSKKEHEYVPGTIFVSKSLFYIAYVELIGIEQAAFLSVNYITPNNINSLNYIFNKHKGFTVNPGEPIFLVDKRISNIKKTGNEYWQILFREKIGWIGVKNLSEFRHYKIKKNYIKSIF